jgi:glycosyltransferase involved in cell wall biosynthesis
MKSILYVQYANPALYPPVERGSWLLASQGWCVRMLGIHAEGASANLVSTPDPRITINLLKHRGPGLSASLSYMQFYRSALREISARRPKVVYCSDLMSYPVGLAATSLFNIPSILHEHDPPKSEGRSSGPLRHIRRVFARRAKLCIVPQVQRAAEFQAATGAPHVVVAYNCPSKAELLTCENQSRRSHFTLWYHGSIGPGQFPSSIVGALAHLPSDVRLEFAGYETIGTKDYVAELMRLASELGLDSRVTYRGAISKRSDLYALASQCDLGLCLFATVFRDPMVGASNKPFDYLACGLPLLTNSTPEWRDFYGSHRVSIECDPERPETIAKAVLTLRENGEARRNMAQRGLALIRSEWNYETQFAKVLDTIDALQ